MIEPMANSKQPAQGKSTKKQDKPRGGPARAIADLVPEIGGSAFRRFGFVQSSIVTRWDEIVGKKYSGISDPESIRFPAGKKSEGTMELRVEPAYAPMIQHVLPDIIERVNRFFGYAAVAKIKLRQGTVATQNSAPIGKAPPLLKAAPIPLGDSLRQVGDPELQAVLESLAKSLALHSENES